MAPDELAQYVGLAGRAGGHRLALQEAPDVQRQAVGRLVAASAVLLKAAHHNPVEVTAEKGGELHGGGGAKLGDGGPVCVP